MAPGIELCPVWAPALGFGGAAIALVMSCVGSAYGTGKAALGISTIGVDLPEIVMKIIIPVVMAGVLGIYGLIIAVIISNSIVATHLGKVAYSQFTGYAHLGAVEGAAPLGGLHVVARTAQDRRMERLGGRLPDNHLVVCRWAASGCHAPEKAAKRLEKSITVIRAELHQLRVAASPAPAQNSSGARRITLAHTIVRLGIGCGSHQHGDCSSIA